MKKDYRGVDGEIGFISAWESGNENVGKGEQKILKITPESRLDYELRFYDLFKATHDAYLVLGKIGDNETNVKWGVDGKMSYPINYYVIISEHGWHAWSRFTNRIR